MNKLKNLLKQSNFIIVYILCSFVFVGCLHEIDSLFGGDKTISSEDLPYFIEGDTIVYTNGNETNLFYVEKAELDQEAGHIIETSDELFEVFYSKIIQINCVDTYYEYRSTVRPKEYYVQLKMIRDSSYSSFELSDYYGGRSVSIESYQLDELYESYNVNSDSTIEKEIISLLYSKKYGVAEYELANGEVFTLSEESLEMLMARE